MCGATYRNTVKHQVEYQVVNMGEPVADKQLRDREMIRYLWKRVAGGDRKDHFPTLVCGCLLWKSSVVTMMPSTAQKIRRNSLTQRERKTEMNSEKGGSITIKMAVVTV